jgi:hypothetical protein
MKTAGHHREQVVLSSRHIEESHHFQLTTHDQLVMALLVGFRGSVSKYLLDIWPF